MADNWDDLPAWQQAAIIGVGALEIVATTVALVDLVRRPRGLVRGPKASWVLACAIQPFGPVAYLTVGRRRA